MAWVNIAKTGNIWAYENSATAAHTYTDAPGSYSGGIRTFDPPGDTPAEQTYIKCRRADSTTIMRGELSKTFWDAQ